MNRSRPRFCSGQRNTFLRGSHGVAENPPAGSRRRGTGPAGKDGFLRNGLGQALQAFPVPGCGVAFVDTALIGSAEDVLCNLSLFGAARRAVYIPSTFYHYRKTASGALTRRYKPDLVAQWEELFRRMDVHVRKHGACPEAERAFGTAWPCPSSFWG